MDQEYTSKSPEDARIFITMVASKQNWKVNTDDRLVETLVKGFSKNYNRYGYYSCPCREAEGVREKDRDIICPCTYCRPDQEEHGHCYCWLFLLPEFYESGSAPRYIPDRRGRKD